ETEPRQGCADDRSDTVSMALSGSETVAKCPDGGLGPGGTPAFCKLDLRYELTACNGYQDVISYYPCIGKVFGNIGWQRPFVDLPGTYGAFAWLPDGKQRKVTALSFTFVPTAGIEGTVSGPGSPNLEVTRAYNFEASGGATWITPPHSTAPAGLMGGPLYLNFDGGAIGATVYIYGFLLRVR
ncbi:MAG TPA: hypothetical protein VN671_00550, partial [Solirubrobacterales bacterium]|nr:hypothetical protein [Solirubrobacterales bacterium]